MQIQEIRVRAIPDTRGKPTIETTLVLDGYRAIASVPSGKSTGSHEARELRDADGGVSQAIQNIETRIAPQLQGYDWHSADAIDDAMLELDGTQDKSRLGANAILSVSIAAQRLFAQVEGIPLWKAIAKRAGTTPSAPRLYVNVLNGGVHAQFRLPFQEYILVCEGPTSSAFATARAAFTELHAIVGDVPMGDEGGFSPTLGTIDEPFDILAKLVAAHPGTFIAIDAAASELFKDGAYRLMDEPYRPDELLRLYEDLAAHYPLRSIEDPFAEDSDADFIGITAALGDRCLIVGDDFTVTNPARIQHTIPERSINAVLIKPNQIGSVKEAIKAVQLTHAAGWKTVCSHRSGETDDTFIADFAYGVGAYGLKAGGLAQKERVEKYERLLEIEKEAA